MHENISTDILIIGGGITGCLIAHQCIENGYETTLIDRREIANGSTSDTTSMLQYEIDIPLYQLNLFSTYVIVEEANKEPTLLKDLLVWNTADPYIYMWTTDDNRLLIGGEDEEYVNASKLDSLLSKKSESLEKN